MAENPSNFYNNFIKYANPPAGGCNWDSDFYRSQYISAIMLAQIKDGNYIKSGLVPSIGAGFNIDYTAGVAVIGGVELAVASGSIAAAAAPIGSVEFNCIYVDDTGAVVVVQADPPETMVAIAIVDTDDTTILRLMEARQLQQYDTTPNPVFQNHIIDGDFNFWYEGTSQTASGYGSDTMWLNSHEISSKVHTQEQFPLGQTDVPGNPKYFSRTVATSIAGASAQVVKHQLIESVSKLSGKTITISFYAKADSSKNMAIDLKQYFGTGGSPSSLVDSIGAQQIALTTSWEKQTITIDIPSISGKTLGTDNNDYLGLYLWFDAGTSLDSRTDSLGQQSGTFDISRVRLVEGEEEGNHINEDYANSLIRVNRYYQKTKVSHGSTVLTNGASSQYHFPEMRVTPSISHNLTNANYGTAWQYQVIGVASATKTGTATLNLSITTKAFAFSTFGATYNIVANFLTATGEFFLLDARL